MMMNERFTEIATEVFFDESTNGPGQKMYMFGELKMQKFAESIVRECAAIALREDHEPSECILKHFGVKR
jgi:hypothetical protein